jgi:hypothetical protein
MVDVRVKAFKQLQKTLKSKMILGCLDCGYKPKANTNPEIAKKYLRRHAIRMGHRVQVTEMRASIYEPVESEW